jgi:hypothetical protein
VRGKNKYDTEDPDITLTWDDAELIADKVQDRSEEAIKTIEAQREKIMAKLIEVHATYNNYGTMQNLRPPHSSKR